MPNDQGASSNRTSWYLTGKTTYLSRQIERAVEQFGPSKVMALSFTKAAAQELRGRKLPIPAEMVGTVHSICYRALGKPVIAETKFDEWNKAHPDKKLTEHTRDADDPYSERDVVTRYDLIFQEYQLLRVGMVPKTSPRWNSTIRYFANQWEDWKKENSYIDFTDMLSLAYESLEEAPGNPDAIFYDEAQDSTPLMLALVRKWGIRCKVFIMCGDVDQCIFSWSGASPEIFLDPNIPTESTRVLDQSYRLPRAVHEYAAEWISSVKVRAPNAQFRPRDADGILRTGASHWKYPEDILADIQKHGYLESGTTVMILASCSYMLAPMLHVLREGGIPFHNPLKPTRGDWNPLSYKHGVRNADRLLAFLRPDEAVWGDQARVWTTHDVSEWAEPLKVEGVFTHGQKTKDAIAEKAKTHTGPVPVSWLQEWFTDTALERAAELDLTWYKSRLLAGKGRALEFPLHIVEKSGAKSLLQNPLVQIGTIHSVKGGEAQVVYLFPDLSNAGYDEYFSPRTTDNIKRVFYVGITRARDELVLCNPVPRNFRAVPWRR